METIIKSNTLTEKFIAEFESSKNSMFGNMDLREQALNAFVSQGIPGRKSEEYKYVNMELVLKGDFSFSANGKIEVTQVEELKFLKDAIVIVIENGKFNASSSKIQSLPKGLEIFNIEGSTSNETFKKHFAKSADVSSDPFIALNTAFSTGGIFIRVAKGSVVEQPIHVIHINSSNQNCLIHTRNLFVIEENANAKIIESFVSINSTAKIFNNAVTEIAIAQLANLNHYKVQDENECGHLVNTTIAYQQKQSVFSTNNYTFSGSLVRNNLTIVLDDEHIETHLNGLYLTKGNQVVDNHTLVDHRKPNCNSNELYKGIIEDKSAATFNGKIYVRKDAQKTNAFQSNKNILLSDDGTINTKPQLEIYADDVKCSHGTSTGKLDEDKIFYLRARGLSEASAKKLLMFAFASEVIENIQLVELKEYLEEKISKRFE